MSYLTQNELFTLGKDGVKVPIPGYQLGKDGIIVPIDSNSYIIGKDGVIIPKKGYRIVKDGLIVKDNDSNSAFKTSSNPFEGRTNVKIEPSHAQIDMTKSNLVLMVGGQILVLVLMLMIVFFGTPDVSFPANAVRNMISRRNVE
jgi:hypothetical protein